jgi:ParB-like chromosome segregation protein Spo0J
MQNMHENEQKGSSPRLVPAQRLIELRVNPNNPREIDAAGQASLTASLRRFGLVDVLVANQTPDGLVLLAGHQRLAVLLGAGVDTAPCLVVELGDTDATELGLMLNGHHGEFDQALLEGILRDLAAQGEAISDIPLGGQAGYDEALAALDKQTRDLEHQIDIEEGDESVMEPGDTLLRVGEEQRPVARDRYLAWREDLRLAISFNEDDIVAELRRRITA